MLKELFESSFYCTYPAKGDVVVNLTEEKYTSAFSLRDEKACLGCHSVCSADDSLRAQLNISTDSAVNVINFDDVFAYMKEAVGEHCDFLLEDEHKVSLIEMTCSNTDNIGRKHQKAKGQLLNTLNILYANPPLKQHLDAKNVKYAVFSWKDTTISNPEIDSVDKDMMSMVLMSDATYSPDNYSEFYDGFYYKEIRFPDALNWTDL